VVFDCVGIEPFSLSFLDGYCILGARADASAESVTIALAYEACLAVDYLYRSLRAGNYTSPATVAFFLIDFDYSSHSQGFYLLKTFFRSDNFVLDSAFLTRLLISLMASPRMHRFPEHIGSGNRHLSGSKSPSIAS